MQNEPFSDSLLESEWKPLTNQEYVDCVLSSVERLTSFVSKGFESIEDTLIAVAHNIHMLIRNKAFRTAVVKFISTVRRTYPSTREPLRRQIRLLIIHEKESSNKLPDYEIAELESIHSDLRDNSLVGRLEEYVGPHEWHKDHQVDLSSLAAELVSSPESFVTAWPWLTSGNANDGLRFGGVIADQDNETRLLDIMLDNTDGAIDLRTLCGYVCHKKRQLGVSWYDNLVESQTNLLQRRARVLIEVAQRCGVTSLFARCIIQILQGNFVPFGDVEKLKYLEMDAGVDSEALADLVRTVYGKGHAATAVFITQRYIRAHPDEAEGWLDLSMSLIIDATLIRAGDMTSYHWQQLALRYVPTHTVPIAEAIFSAHFDRSIEYWFIKHKEAERVLRECVQANPTAVWTVLKSRLSAQQSDYHCSIGFPKDILSRFATADVLSWIEADPSSRLCLIVRMVPLDFENERTLTCQVIAKYGDRDDVRDAFFNEYVYGVWMGQASEHWDNLATPLRRLAGLTTLRTLREWANYSCQRLAEMSLRERRVEEEEGINRY
jgi:hypothetical protein